MFFSGNSKEIEDFPDIDLPQFSLSKLMDDSEEKKNRKTNEKISLSKNGMFTSYSAFNRTKENLLLSNRYATDSFGRSYENILTPCYLAPEELTHNKLSLKEEMKADLFKLGCVLYELYTSQPLFTISSLQEYVHSNSDAASLTGLNTISEPIRVPIQLSYSQ